MTSCRDDGSGCERSDRIGDAHRVALLRPWKRRIQRGNAAGRHAGFDIVVRFVRDNSRFSTGVIVIEFLAVTHLGRYDFEL